MKTIITTILIAITLYACDDMKKGYLETQEAGYVTNSMTIYLQPSSTDTVSYQSEPIQSVIRTFPITYEIAAIRDSTGSIVPVFIASQIRCVRNAVYEISKNHTIPIGRYTVDLWVININSSILLHEIHTIIVREQDE